MLGRGLLPEGEIHRAVLVLLAVQRARVLDYVVEVAARETPVVVFAVVFLDVEVYRSVRDVGVACVEDTLDELDLLDYVSRGAWLDRGREHVHRLHGVVVTLRIVVRHLHGLQLLETRLLGDLVLALVGVVLEVADVGDVAHVAHLVTQSLQIAEQEVEGDGGACMTQMRVAVNGGAADVHAHVLGIDRLEELLAARERIVQIEFAVHIF